MRLVFTNDYLTGMTGRLLRGIIPCIFILIAAGCATLRLNNENHAGAIARSVRDSTLAISLDTAFYAGRPLYRVAGGAGITGGNPIEIYDITGSRYLAKAYPRYYLRNDSVVYRISMHDFGTKVLVKVKSAAAYLEEASVVKFLVDHGILRGGAVDVPATTRLLAAGIIQDDDVAGPAYANISTNWRQTTASPAAVNGMVGGTVTVRNLCPNTVHLFIGEKPGYSSGQTESISGNGSGMMGAIQRGGMLWIVDEDRNPISSTTVGPNTTTITISADGHGMSQE